MRTTTKLLAAALAGTALLAACDGPGLETRTFRLDHLEAGEAMSLVEPYVFRERPGWPGRASTVRGALTVRETTDNLDRIVRVLEEFDIPQEDVRLRFQLIEADGSGGTDPAVADVVSELREVFRFEGYRLLAETVVTTAVYSEFRQYLSGSEEPWQVSGRVHRPASQGLRLQEIELNGAQSSPLRTSATVRIGQTLVLGSSARWNRDYTQRDGPVILIVRVERADG